MTAHGFSNVFTIYLCFQGDIGLNAAHMVMELVKDNRRIVDRITHDHIDSFVALLRKNKVCMHCIGKEIWYENLCSRSMYQGQGHVITSHRYCGM